jgi:hypothetical protein
MTLLHPERVAAAWLRSGVPSVKTVEGKPPAYPVSEAACGVPLMCNLGTKEGVTVKDGRFASVWSGVETFFYELRGKGGLTGVAVDPLTAHECGNQRYLAIPWLDACLASRLPLKSGEPLQKIPEATAWLAPVSVKATEVIAPVQASKFSGEVNKSVWLPNESIAMKWLQYVQNTVVPDSTPPPAPTNLRVSGNELSWEADADLESGLAGFIIERDGQFLANVPEQPKNPFGRPLFQGLQYSDTPIQPLLEMRFTDTRAETGVTYKYRVISVNTAGLKSN